MQESQHVAERQNVSREILQGKMGKLDPLETIGQATVVHVELISIAIAFVSDKFAKLLQFGG